MYENRVDGPFFDGVNKSIQRQHFSFDIKISKLLKCWLSAAIGG